MDVIGVGDIDIDIYLELDHVPRRDEKVVAKSYTYYPGGMVANFLAALSRLGTLCGFHGPLGQDEFGRLALQDLKENNVDTKFAVIKSDGNTYYCVVMLDPSGEKSLVVVPTNCLTLEPEDLFLPALNQARHLHTTYHGKTQATAINFAKQNGLTVSVDFEPDSVKNGNNLIPVLANIDLAFINKRAASLITGNNDLELSILQISAMGPSIVCITMGEDGSILAAKDWKEPQFISAFHVPVVDTTGAGDCFAAGFVHGYLQGWPVEIMGTFASAVASINIMSKGGHLGAPYFNEVVEFLKNRDVNLSASIQGKTIGGLA